MLDRQNGQTTATLLMSSKPRSIPAAVILSLLCATYLVVSWHKTSFASFSMPMPPPKMRPRLRHHQGRVSLVDMGNYSVLSSMTKGTWQQHPMTPAEELKLKVFYKTARVVQHGMPESLQRADGRCGDVAFVHRGGFQRAAFRALCNAEGPTPCCYNQVCVNKTRDQCVCSNCLDMRSRIHAEYATWRPAQTQREPRKLSVPQICRLLANSTIRFMGASLMRHFYTGFVLTVSGNDVTGAQARNIPKGMYMFTEKTCRLWLNTNFKACNGTVQLQYLAYHLIKHAQKISQAVLELGNRSKTMVVLSGGVHNGLQAEAVRDKVMLPLLSNMTSLNLTWPKLLWAGIHQWGLLKNDRVYRTQSVARVKNFNKQMETFLGQFGVPFFDTFNLTGSVMSFDGTHFGLGVNKVKALIFLNYLLELQSKGQW